MNAKTVVYQRLARRLGTVLLAT